jgi:hypothetical protein
MCEKPSCGCSSKSAEGIGIIAMAVIALAIIGTVGPILVAISHVVVDVIKLAAIGIASGAMLAVAIWIAVQVMRARAVNRPLSRIHLTARQEPARIKSARASVSEQSCITCGDTGRIVRLIGNGDSYRIRACPECQPAQLTR